MAEEVSGWVRFEGKLVVSDVLRWSEAIWPERKRRSKKHKVLPHGKRRVTAQVLEVDSRGYVRLSVMQDEIIENKHGMPLKTSKIADVIVRKSTTIEKGNPERMKWQDEAHRSAEVSAFLA